MRVPIKRKPSTHLENLILEKQRRTKRRESERSEVKKQIRLKEDQAKKSTGRIPRHRTPMKDVVSCEKLWGAANRP